MNCFRKASSLCSLPYVAHDTPPNVTGESHQLLFVALHTLTGDYSDAQLLRVNRQAIVLHKYYGLLAEAITEHQQSGALYVVTCLGAKAGQVLGDERVAVSTVRYWHADYVEGRMASSDQTREATTRESCW